MEITYLSGAMYREGIQEHRTPAGIVRVYSVAKTIVDCFRFRNKIGLDVALQALRDVVRSRARHRTTIAAIAEMAGKCRVANVMRPYLEAMGS
jgi:hypothetical protein